ncbi:M14 family zinc carboxypeptidase [Gilvibacter sp.]|uniref:M14 family zinc carboxypeptidase n=1 Tax=Gilvibacter sp. TaxID=2729997 RepID=UPI003F4A7D4E
MRKFLFLTILSFLMLIPAAQAQDYFLKDQGPFNPDIPSPEAYLEYPIGSQHTRHDMMVAYFKMLAQVSDRATIETYGKTHEGRKLVMLTISTPANLQNLETIKAEHLKYVDPKQSPSAYESLPIFIQLGYNVHGNEPSGGEAALLTAYTLVASNNPEVLNYLENGIIMIDPTINPDGRDRHTQWANQYKANPLVSDPMDAEHWEAWPRGRTNHYWFDLNRDWLLGINPESRGKLKWYHQWYPNVVTDFHEMGTNSTYFFEPMKPIGSLDPIMPKENYEDLNNLFATYYEDALNGIGSFYYTKESFDGTYPGYGSSYPDLQGLWRFYLNRRVPAAMSKKLLLERSPFRLPSETNTLPVWQRYRLRGNKGTLRKYQQDFFKSAVNEKAPTGYAAYTFNKGTDGNRMKAFIDKLLLHEIEVYKSGDQYSVPLAQPQRRMVQSFFELIKAIVIRYSMMPLLGVLLIFTMFLTEGKTRNPGGTPVTSTDGITNVKNVPQSGYAYLMGLERLQRPSCFVSFAVQGHSGKCCF